MARALAEAGVGVLMTSRRDLAIAPAGPVEVVRLGPLPPRHCRELVARLEDLYGRLLAPAAVAEALTYAGALPLALRRAFEGPGGAPTRDDDLAREHDMLAALGAWAAARPLPPIVTRWHGLLALRLGVRARCSSPTSLARLDQRIFDVSPDLSVERDASRAFA